MYGKIFSSLFHGSMIGQRNAQHVFVYLISHADRDGHVDAHPREVSALTGIPEPEVADAFRVLSEPDEHSRTQEDDGRRIERIDQSWTWLIINYAKYLSMQDREVVRDQTKQRVRKHREKKRSVTVGNGSKRQGEGEVEREAESLTDSPKTSSSTNQSPGGDVSEPQDQQKALAAMIVGIANGKKMRPKESDWRPQAWEDARSIGRTPAEAQALMEFAGWLKKHHTQSRYVCQRAMRFIVQNKILNPQAYFSADGKALNALIGENAERLHAQEKRQIEAAERDMFRPAAQDSATA